MFSNCECKCDLIAAEMSNLSLSDCSKCTKTSFRPGLRPGFRCRSLRRSPDSLLPSRRGRGHPLPILSPSRRRRRLDLGAYGASVVRPPMNAWQRLLLLEIMTSWLFSKFCLHRI